MSGESVSERMRDDWNRRAREDAKYYVAFGRRGQDDAEFHDTARQVVRGLLEETNRLAERNPRAWRALEIGCGPGRILRHLAPQFGELHGVDVSDEMIALAEQNLREFPHVHVHASDGTNLNLFGDNSFDFVYSYAVFQHIPSREVIFRYLTEARRVLKPGGILRCQMNSLPVTTLNVDTWAGVSIRGDEAAAFAWNQDLQLLAQDGAGTQYMWLTMRKRPVGWRGTLDALADSAKPAFVRRLTNWKSSEPLAPNRGGYAGLSLWMEDLHEEVDLNGLRVLVGGRPATVTYVGPTRLGGLRQVSAILPEGLDTGLQTVRMYWLNRAVSSEVLFRVIPQGPRVPRIVTVTDGLNYLSGPRILSGTIKVVLEEAGPATDFSATIDGVPVERLESLCTDPLADRYEVNFRLPSGISPGPKRILVRLGQRELSPVDIDVVTTG